MAPHWIQKLRSSKKANLSSISSGDASSNDSVNNLRGAQAGSPAQKVQERIWNDAYDNIKITDGNLIEAYEKIISHELCGKLSASDEGWSNQIGSNGTPRWQQMRQLVQSSLEKNQNETSAKSVIKDGFQLVTSLQEVMEKAVKTCPQASLAWVGVCQALEIISNPISEPRINRSGMAYIVSRMDWYWHMAELLLDTNLVHPSTLGLRAQLETHIVNLYQKLLLYQIQSICLYHRNDVGAFLRDLLKLNDWNGRLDEIREAESKIIQNSDQYNTQQVKLYLRNIASSASKHEIKFNDIESAIRDQTNLQNTSHQDDKDKECVKDLRLTDPRDDKTRIQQIKGGLLGELCDWIVDNKDFRQWRTDPEQRLLWVTADPGKGKTMLLCRTIDELANQSYQLAYFLCQATDPQLRSATAVLRGLLFLLVDQNPSLISYVREKYDTSGKPLFDDINSWAALSKILLNMLDDPSLDQAILVIDALDECSDFRQLLDLISESCSRSRSKWLVSSRNLLEIEEKLESAPHHLRLSLEQAQDSISAAVEGYIDIQVDKLAQTKRYDSKTKNSVREHLYSNADNTFLWVALVCRELEGIPRTKKWPHLEKMTAFPRGLDALYSRMMETILNDPVDSQQHTEVLAIVSTAYRPISLLELGALAKSLHEMDYDIETLQDIVNSCGSFIAVRKEIVYFIHESAKEFLVRQMRARILPHGSAYQHYLMFSNSMDALNNILQRDMHELGDPGFTIEDEYCRQPDPLLPVRYSCNYWIDHFVDASAVDDAQNAGSLKRTDILFGFIKEKFVYWLEALSLLHSVPQGIRKMEFSTTMWFVPIETRCVGNSLTRTQIQLELGISKEVSDALRFLVYISRGLVIAPLQVYTSGLLFSPTKSLIKQWFAKESPKWAKLSGSLNEDWDACIQTLEGHSGPVRSICPSDDGKCLASASDDGTIKIWDLTAGQCAKTLQLGGKTPRAIVFLSNRELMSALGDATFARWDIIDGKCLGIVECPEKWELDPRVKVCLSGNGMRAAAAVGESIKVWDTASGACLYNQPRWYTHRDFQGNTGYREPTESLSTDGQLLATPGEGHTVKVWDVLTGSCLLTIQGHDRLIRAIIFSNDDQLIASISYDRKARIWDAKTGKCTKELETLSYFAMSSCAFSHDGQRFATFSEGWREVNVWDIAQGNHIQRFRGHNKQLSCGIFAADDHQQVISASLDSTIKVWDTNTSASGAHVHQTPADMLWYSGDRKPASAHYVKGELLNVWDVGQSQRIFSVPLGGYTVSDAVFSEDRNRLILGFCEGKSIEVWDLNTEKLLHSRPKICPSSQEYRQEPGYRTLFSPDGERALENSGNGHYQIIDTQSLSTIHSITGPKGSGSGGIFEPNVKSQFSVDNSRLFLGDLLNKEAYVWDLESGCLLDKLSFNSRPECPYFSGDNNLLTIGFDTGDITISDMSTKKIRYTLTGHRRPIKQLRFSGDSLYLASLCLDRDIRLWDMNTGTCSQTIDLRDWLGDWGTFFFEFDAQSSFCLRMNCGTIDLRPLLKDGKSENHRVTSGEVVFSGYGFSFDGAWIMNGSKKVLWLPTEWRLGLALRTESLIIPGFADKIRMAVLSVDFESK